MIHWELHHQREQESTVSLTVTSRVQVLNQDPILAPHQIPSHQRDNNHGQITDNQVLKLLHPSNNHSRGRHHFKTNLEMMTIRGIVTTSMDGVQTSTMTTAEESFTTEIPTVTITSMVVVISPITTRDAMARIATDIIQTIQLNHRGICGLADFITWMWIKQSCVVILNRLESWRA